MAGRIEKRGENAYRLIAYGGYDSNGKQVIYRKTVKTNSKKEAEKMLAEFVTEVERGQITTNKNHDFEEFINIWLKDYAQTQLAPKTLFRYQEMLKSRIIPSLGHLSLNKIKPNHLLTFYSYLEGDNIRLDGKQGGLSERTILHHHRLIHAILETAVNWQYLFDNPASRVKPPKVPKKQMHVFNAVDLAILLQSLEQEPLKYQVIVLLALATGMRQGEIMGLEWRHVDFSNNTIKIEQCAQYLPGIGEFLKDPKNETSKRTVSVPTSIIDLLKKYQKEQMEQKTLLADKWQGSERLFTTWDGNPMQPIQMSTWFPKFLKRHNLPHIPFHGLRHTNATLLIANGATATDLSRMLGHANTTTTLNIYTHSFQNANTLLADKMGNILNNISDKSKELDNFE